ncbi:MAG: hypothetical protein HUJ56_11585 [Erysipelotrichaceae bacterium]|nr:hypothetical protein [Erysipelotrichaceae bacterium]
MNDVNSSSDLDGSVILGLLKIGGIIVGAIILFSIIANIVKHWGETSDKAKGWTIIITIFGIMFIIAFICDN